MRWRKLLALLGALLLPVPAAIVVNRRVSPISWGGNGLHNIVPLMAGLALGVACLWAYPAAARRRGLAVLGYVLVYPVLALGLFAAL